ncbi:hypothetical protein [Hydrogenimonas cancrithermarum]|uniref:Uncharacterized protein n=1 Tax=Hydrogenimonas cancrithermarum TaxID=2993563 RepID=A0ABM8FP99_9BACT|nr:hypothetical protein [Hydrogenimonas cancrithermarum]BDY13767.1 hypothetical protein HCR_20790 [Hydrogenimonas cancrithermarum]
MRILPRNYIGYKGVNSFFTGMTVGAVFTIYAALDPSIFSLGGIVLAVGMLVIAKFYETILNLRAFYRISLLVEWVMLGLVALYLFRPYAFSTALLVYAGYQVTFMFGAYLVRAETLFLNRKRILSWLDMAKQTGYLAGMLVSWLFYKMLVWGWHIEDHARQVYYLHWLLLVTEILILRLLVRSFEKVEQRATTR